MESSISVPSWKVGGRITWALLGAAGPLKRTLRGLQEDIYPLGSLVRDLEAEGQGPLRLAWFPVSESVTNVLHSFERAHQSIDHWPLA